MIPWEITIKRAENGYTLTWAEELEDSCVRECSHVVEEADIGEGEAKGMADLLWFIKEHFGDHGNKYSKAQVIVDIKHGRDYECKDKKCEICKEE